MQNQNNILFSIVIPMYNGEYYIDNSMHSILNNMTSEAEIFDFIEIIIINDGSTDNGVEKAKVWQEKWNKTVRNDFIKVINKENGQYGSVINRALEEVKGKYIKILDVDDSFNSKHFIDIVHIIAGFKVPIDVIITDFIFDKVLKNKQIVYKWNKYFKPYQIIRMSEANYPNSIITMHSIIYNVNFLRSIEYKQIEGVYYSDSQYSVIPFVQAKWLYYINIPLYRYYIGRNDQSINIKSMVKHRLDQKDVMDAIVDELLEIEPNSQKQIKYGWGVAKNMFEWESMIISHDDSVSDRNKTIYENLRDLLKLCKDKNNNLAYNVINKGILSTVIKITRGHGITRIIRLGERLYARFKLNIMADWDKN